MRCSIEGCAGEYEDGQIVHTIRYGGEVRVIDHVPASICSVCGDVLLKPETLRRIETLLQSGVRPSSTAPVYEYK